MCEFCKRADFGKYKIEITERFVTISTAGGSYRFPKEKQFNFCPVCGEDLRKEVQNG